MVAVLPEKTQPWPGVESVEINKPDGELTEQMIVATEQARKSPDWQKARGKYIPYPATWLRARGWLDQFVVDFRSTATDSEACSTTIENLNQLFGDAEEDVRGANGLLVSRV